MVQMKEKIFSYDQCSTKRIKFYSRLNFPYQKSYTEGGRRISMNNPDYSTQLIGIFSSAKQM